MATEQVNVIEGDGSSDTVTVTDDPVENQTVQAVKNAIGDETTASVQEDPTLAATLQELLAGLSALLRGALAGKDNDDEVRVRIQEQSGDVSVSLGGEKVTIDSLPSVDISSQSAGIATDSTLSDLNSAIGDGGDTAETDETSAASLLAFVKGAVKLLGGTLTVTDDGSLTLAANDGTDIGDVGIEDLSKVSGQGSKSGSLPVTLASNEDTVPTEQQSPVKIEDSSGTPIDPATEGKLEQVRSILDKLDDALTSVGSDEVRVTIENGASPVAFPDTGRRTVSTAGSPEALVSAPAPVASGVEVKAMPGNGNTAYVWISGEGKSDSYPLAAGDEVFMPVDDASKVIVDVDTGGDTVAFVAA